MSPRPLLLFLLVLLPLPAAAQQTRNEAGVSFGRADLNQLGDGPAFGVSYNRYWNRMFSTRFGLFAGGDDTGGADVVSGAWHLTAEIHPLGDRLVSPWAGIGLALAATSIDHEGDGFVTNDTAFTGIYSGGIDVNVTRRFAIGGEVLHMRYRADTGDRFEPNVDPLMVMATARFRW